MHLNAKWCNRCKRILSYGYFFVTQHEGKQRPMSQCKECRKETHLEYIRRKKDESGILFATERKKNPTHANHLQAYRDKAKQWLPL